MFKIGKYLSTNKLQEDYEDLFWKDKETALLQTIIDNVLTSCIVSVTVEVGMAATQATMQKLH